jgi:BASS family bile acid:Na+ symporter
MTLAQLIPLAINVSMGLIVLALGLNASTADLTYLLRNPGLLVRSILSMNIIMPVFAAAVAALFNLDPAIKIALVAVALSPVPPILPSKQEKAGGGESYVVALLGTAAVLAIVLVPLGIELLSHVFGRSERVSAGTVAQVVLVSVIVPLVIGVIVHQLAPAFAERVARWVSIAGSVLLVVAFIPVLIGSWHLILDVVGNGTIIVLALFTLVGVAVGHLLGGPDEDSRTVLALATGTRHPGVALAIAGATFPDVKAVLAVVLWHLIVGGIVSGPYAKWRTRVHGALAAAKPTAGSPTASGP